MFELTTPDDNNSNCGPTSNIPTHTFILKVASRCNLNCRYCYVYNQGDNSYLNQPKRMSAQVVSATIDRVRAYGLANNLDAVQFIFHGGEPLLAGKEFFRRFVGEANEGLRPEVTPIFNMQTNGTLLDQEWLDLLFELNIGFGISLDGPKEINDANRIDHFGNGSYDEVRTAIELVLSDPRMAELFGGLLTVINLAAEPLELYRSYRDMGISSIDFLLPDGHYDNPPPGLTLSGDGTPFADWLIKVFDAWFDAGDATIHIRVFEDILALIFGSKHSTDNIGGSANGILVIETDGGIEPVDVLKICGDGFTKLGYSVLTNQINDIFQSNLVNRYQSGRNSLCDKCQACRIRDVCGGGYLPQRYSSLTGFDNPSVYCRDLMKLIVHIHSRLLTTIPDGIRNKLGLAPVSQTSFVAGV